MLDNIIKRVLMVPQSTPREVLYIESGLLDARTIINKNRIMMEHRIKEGQNNLMKQLILTEHKGSWNKETEKIKNDLQVTAQDLLGKKYTVKQNIKEKATKHMIEKMLEEGQNKSKVQFLLENKKNTWNPGTRPEYMNKLTRTQTSTLFKCRTRMLEVKENFKNMFTDNTCRMCGITTETQTHILEECKEVHQTNDLLTYKEEIFRNNIQELKITAKKVETIMNMIKSKK